MGGKTRETIFPETHEYCEQKMLGTKSSEKSEKKVLLYHTNIVTKKWVGKKRAKQFFQKHKNNAIKNCWGKKSSQKSAEIFFYIYTNTVKKMVGEKKRESIFPETHE